MTSRQYARLLALFQMAIFDDLGNAWLFSNELQYAVHEDDKPPRNSELYIEYKG